MNEKAIIMFVVRDGDKLNDKYLAWSDEKQEEFHSDNREEAWVQKMVDAEEKWLLLSKNKDNEYPIVIPVADEE